MGHLLTFTYPGAGDLIRSGDKVMTTRRRTETWKRKWDRSPVRTLSLWEGSPRACRKPDEATKIGEVPWLHYVARYGSALTHRDALADGFGSYGMMAFDAYLETLGDLNAMTRHQVKAHEWGLILWGPPKGGWS